ncbi:MAG: hypothetical protein ACTJLK_02400 [Anaplasma sp.]
MNVAEREDQVVEHLQRMQGLFGWLGPESMQLWNGKGSADMAYVLCGCPTGLTICVIV